MAAKRRRTDSDFPAGNEHCCCPPKALIWGDARSTSVAVGNLIDQKAQLQVRADANASIKPPGGPDTNADGSGGSRIIDEHLKPVDLIQKTDAYTIHWKADGLCRPLEVSLQVGGEVVFSQGCLPEEGSVTLSRAKIFKYEEFASRAMGSVRARIVVKDCAGKQGSCSLTLGEP